MVDEFGERLGTVDLHGSKVGACKRLVDNLKGEPVVICYWFKHELERLKLAFPEAVELNEKGAQEAWNAGEVEILLMQPMSASHGIQLQHGGRNMIFFAPIWSNDIVSQTIARLWRKGQKQAVRVWELVAAGTVDEMIVDRVKGKEKFDALFSKLLG